MKPSSQTIFILIHTLVISLTPATSLSTPSPHYTQTRRNILSNIAQTTTTATATATILLHPSNANAAPTTTSIEDRLRSNQNLTLPPPSRPSELNGIDNLYYPSWLAGTWDVTQTLTDTSTPLGLKYIGGPNGSVEIATQSLNEQKKQLDVPVNLRLRYISSKFGVAEDRLFNTKQRLDAFAGRSVVSSVEYADVGGSNRGSVLMMGGDNDTPLQTTGSYVFDIFDDMEFQRLGFYLLCIFLGNILTYFSLTLFHFSCILQSC